jgi:hypothetical protein
MTQSQLDRAVARATGESLRTIANRGFSIVSPGTLRHDPEPDRSRPHVINWDRVDRQRVRLFP